MNEWEQKEGEGGGVGVGERDEQAHPILIPGQAGVHSCCCSHSRAWMWLGKGSINQLMLQEAAYSGAAVRDALSRVCAGVPQPCTPACSTRVRVPCPSVPRAGLAVHKHRTPSPAPGEGLVCHGEESIAPVLRANTSCTARGPLAPTPGSHEHGGSKQKGCTCAGQT